MVILLKINSKVMATISHTMFDFLLDLLTSGCLIRIRILICIEIHCILSKLKSIFFTKDASKPKMSLVKLFYHFYDIEYFCWRKIVIGDKKYADIRKLVGKLSLKIMFLKLHIFL